MATEKIPTQKEINAIKKAYSAEQAKIQADAGKAAAGTYQPTVTIGGAPAGYKYVPQVSPSEKIVADYNAAVASIPTTIKEIDTTISDIDKQIADVNTAGQEAGLISQSMGGPSWNYINDTGKPVEDTSRQDAYQKLYDEFNAIGLGALVSDAKDLLMRATSISAMPDALRGTKAYTDRFSANDARIKAGLKALSPAAYLNMEDKYQEVMRQYGLPESYYKTGLYGKQEGFEKLLASDVSNVELEDRLITAQQRVLNSNPEVLKAIKDFYGDSVTNGDILAYALDPSKAIQDIKKKVTAAEIQSAANVFGLNQITKESTPEQIKALEARAAALAGQGVDKEAALTGFETVSDLTPRGSQLAEIYKESPYTQGTAEAEVFKTAGSAEAKAKRKRLTGKETASFSGSSGVGALGRDRATNYGTTQSGFGQY
jgi:hypothetical protein